MSTLNTSIVKKNEASQPRKGRLPADAGQGAQAPSDRIRGRAYEIYQSRNGGPGDAMSDWLQAERELNGPVPFPAPDQAVSGDAEVKARVRGEKLMALGK